LEGAATTSVQQTNAACRQLVDAAHQLERPLGEAMAALWRIEQLAHGPANVRLHALAEKLFGRRVGGNGFETGLDAFDQELDT